MLIGWIGEDVLSNVLFNRPVIGAMLAGLIGMIPNCAASVAVTQLYLNGVLSAGAMLAGLLSGTGIGLIVLLRVNDERKENLKFIGLLYIVGVLAGVVIEAMGITF